MLLISFMVTSFYFIGIYAKADYDLTLFVRETEKNKRYNLTCVYTGTNINSSILWNDYKILPTININNFNVIENSFVDCNIAPDEECTKNWKNEKFQLRNSLNFTFGIVNDYRLDYFKIMNEVKEFHVPYETIEIPFSLINYDNLTVIEIETDQKYSKFDDLDKCISHDKKWNDVLIQMNSSMVVLNCDGRMIFSNVTFTKLRIDSSKTKLIIHDYAFLHTNHTGTYNLGPRFILKENEYFCVSMFIAMCNNCTLTLFLYDENKNIHKETVQNDDTKWRKYRFIINQKLFGKFHLQVRTVGNSNNVFWAIDYVQRCSLKDIRTCSQIVDLENLDKSYCNLLNNNNSIHVRNNSKSYKGDPPNCLQYQFGKSCTNCGLIFDKDLMCGGRSECFNSDNATICNCKDGYFGQYCNEKCKSGFYGKNCDGECKNCENNRCHHITGNCCQTETNFDFCNYRFYCPVSMYPPIIINTNYTWIQVKLDSLKIINEHLGLGYFLEYSECGTNESKTLKFTWKSLNTTHDIRDLKRNTKYEIRSVLWGEYSCETSSPNLTFKTNCLSYTKYNVFPRENNLVLRINDTNSTEAYCSRAECLTTLTISDNVVFNKTLNTITNFSLYSSTYYVMFVKCRSNNVETIRFKTLPKKLHEVQNVTFNPTDRFMQIKWDRPNGAEGIIDLYTISYQLKERSNCTSLSNEIHTRNVTITEFSLNDLHPYSKYSISIMAFNGKYGDVFRTVAQTLPTGFLKEKELSALTLGERDTKISISYSGSDCRKIEGPIFCEVNVNCLNTWCVDRNQTVFCEHIENDSCTVKSQPFANYTISFNCGRNKGIYTKSLRKHIETKPTIPGPIEHMTVYSRSYNYISVRWKPSYPPNGILNYCLYTAIMKEETKKKNDTKSWQDSCVRCSLWTEFYCHNLTNLTYPSTDYRVELAAYNVNVSKSRKNEIETRTEPGRPSKPLNVHFDYDESDNVVVRWSHPDNPNAPLSKFRIKFFDNDTDFAYEEQLNYSYTISAQLSPEHIYDLKIFAMTIEEDSGDQENLKIFAAPIKPQIPDDIRVLIDENDEHFIRIPCNNFKGYIYVIVGDYLTEEEEARNMRQKLNKCMIHEISKGWIAGELSNCSSTIDYILGSDVRRSSTRERSLLIENRKFSKEKYTINVLFLNEFENVKRCSSSQVSYVRSAISKDRSYLTTIIVVVIAMLFAFAIIIGILCWKRKLNMDLCFCLTLQSTVKNQLVAEAIPLTRNIEHFEQSTVEYNKHGKETHLTKSIGVKEFKDYLKKSLENNNLQQQFKRLAQGQTKSWYNGMLLKNKEKNRYINLLPYDETRVALNAVDGVTNDYINANYIKGYDRTVAYIATQGPKLNTINDFWQMIWQENVKCIVMLTNTIENGKKKCEKYWPNFNQVCQYDEIKVRFVTCTSYTHFKHRVFIVSGESSVRQVEQYHFLSWNDHSVPLHVHSLVHFAIKILRIHQDGTSPIVVHCSAGVGRTGTIILYDICLRMIRREGKVDVLYELSKLREQRANMVNNIKQYELLHLMLLEYILDRNASIDCDENVYEEIRDVLDKNIDQQLTNIDDSMWIDNRVKALIHDTEEEIITYLGKDRFPNIIPEPDVRVFLTITPHHDESSSYINAVKVDGLCKPMKYIVTQQPLPNTISDFWRLINEYDVSVIVSLNEIDLGNETSYFWPIDKNEDFNLVHYLRLKLIEIKEYEFYKIYTLHLVVSKIESPEERVVRLIQVKNWYCNIFVPEEPEQLLEILEASNKYSCNDRPTVVTCFDGATASGLLVATSFIVELINTDDVCDVCLAVRTIRQFRKEFIRDRSQFKYLYEVVLKYLEKLKLSN